MAFCRAEQGNIIAPCVKTLRPLSVRIACSMFMLAATAVAAPAAYASAVPQFQVEFFSGQMFWGTLSFLLLLYLLRRFLLPRMNQVLDERSTFVREQLESATHARQKADELLASYQQLHAQLEDERRAMLLAVEHEMIAMRDEKLDEIRRTQQRYKQELLDEAAYAKQKASEDIGRMALELALSAVDRLWQQQPPPRQQLSAIIDELQQQGKDAPS